MSFDENDILFGQNSLTHDEYILVSDTKQHGMSRDGNRYWESGIWRWPGENEAKLQTTFSRREGTDFRIDLHVAGYVRNWAVIIGIVWCIDRVWLRFLELSSPVPPNSYNNIGCKYRRVFWENEDIVWEDPDEHGLEFPFYHYCPIRMLCPGLEGRSVGLRETFTN